MPSFQKQITEIKVEGMIADYSSSCCTISKKHLTQHYSHLILIGATNRSHVFIKRHNHVTVSDEIGKKLHSQYTLKCVEISTINYY